MIGYFNTLIRYYLHQDPDGLSDQQWAETIAQLKHIRESEAKPIAELKHIRKSEAKTK